MRNEIWNKIERSNIRKSIRNKNIYERKDDNWIRSSRKLIRNEFKKKTFLKINENRQIW